MTFLRFICVAVVLVVYVWAMIRLRKMFYDLEEDTDKDDVKFNTEERRNKNE